MPDLALMMSEGLQTLGKVAGAWKGVALFAAWRMSGLGTILRLTAVLISQESIFDLGCLLSQ